MRLVLYGVSGDIIEQAVYAFLWIEAGINAKSSNCHILFVVIVQAVASLN